MITSPVRVVGAAVVAGVMIASLPGAAFAQTAEAYFQFLMARRLESQGDEAGALAALERATAAAPASAEVKAEIASFQLRRNRRVEAERAAREAVVLDAQNVEAHRVLGTIYASLVQSANQRTPAAQTEANVREAITHLEIATGDGAPADINLSYTLGQLYMRTGDFANAVTALNRVVSLNPNSLQARLLLAQAYASSGDVTGAIGALELIVDDEPRVASTLAQFQEQAGLFREAADTYTKAIAVQPMSRELKFRRATVLFRAGEFARAETAAAEAQAQHPDDLRFPRLRARSLYEGGSPAAALGILEPMAKQFPGDTGTQFELADLYGEMGRDADAERVLRQLIVIDPDNADALNFLGYMLADNNRQLDEAIRLIQRALDADPGNPAFLDSLGWAYYRQGNFEQAERYLSPAAERLPDNSVIQDHFGDVLVQRGRLQDAIAAWTRALSGDGDDIDRAVVEQKIRDAQGRLNR